MLEVGGLSVVTREVVAALLFLDSLSTTAVDGALSDSISATEYLYCLGHLYVACGA